MTHRIAIVEDDESIRRILADALAEQGYPVVAYADGASGLAGLRASPPSLVLLDLRLPGISGIDVCRALRADPATARILVVMITGLNAEADQILGFEVGADDYVIKPFALATLTARVQGVLRRISPSATDAPMTYGPLVVNPMRCEAVLSGKTLSLTPTEFRILQLLVSNPDRTLSRQELIEGDAGGKDGKERKADVHVTALRAKLGSSGRLIDTVYGKGYRIAKID